MSSNVVTSWGWQRKVVETCRLAFVIQIFVHLVGNKLVYKRNQFSQMSAAINLWLISTIITTLVKVRVVAGRSRTLLVAHRPSQDLGISIHTCSAVLRSWCVVALRNRIHGCTVGAQLCMCASDTVSLCDSNGNDTVLIFNDTIRSGSNLICVN